MKTAFVRLQDAKSALNGVKLKVDSFCIQRGVACPKRAGARRKTMKTKLALIGAVTAALLTAGCANDGTAYRSDVYWAGQVNQAQEVKTVQIIAVMPARITVDNRYERDDSATMGTILGALAGAVIGATVSDSPDAVIAGTVGGAALGNVTGKGVSGRSENFVEGVQITFRQGDRIFNSAQVGRVCEFKTGTAIMVSPSPNETRIQPNNPYGCGPSSH